MSDERIDRILKKLREKLADDNVPDDTTGKVSFDLQTGMVSGDVILTRKL